jgi:hypothetical protein
VVRSPVRGPYAAFGRRERRPQPGRNKPSCAPRLNDRDAAVDWGRLKKRETGTRQQDRRGCSGPA